MSNEPTPRDSAAPSSRITRRRLLQAATVGAAGLALPEVAEVGALAAGRTLPRYLRDGRFAIGTFAEVTGTRAGLEHLRDQGVGLLFLGRGAERIGSTLDHAHAVKARVVADVDDVDPHAYDHPGLAGVSFGAASTGSISRLADKVESLRWRAPELLPYVPVPTGAGVRPFTGLLRAVGACVAPPLVSFATPDAAALSDADHIRAWAAVRAQARAMGVGTWGPLVTSTRDGSALEPTVLLWRMNVALAYGARGLVYSEAPSACLSDAVARTNRQWLQPVGDELALMRPLAVGHAGSIPEGASAFRSDGWIHAVEGRGPLIVGSFGSLVRRDRRWALVVNGRHDRTTALTVSFAGQVRRVARYDPTEDTYRAMPGDIASGRGSLRFALKPGAAVLLRMSIGR